MLKVGIFTCMTSSFQCFLGNFHGSNQRRMWSNNLVIPHYSKTEWILPSTVVG